MPHITEATSWNEDPDYASLPYRRKKKILKNYFDQNVVDDNFKNLNPEHQDLARNYFYVTSIGYPKRGIKPKDERLDGLVSRMEELRMRRAEEKAKKENEKITDPNEDQPTLGQRQSGGSMPSYNQFANKKTGGGTETGTGEAGTSGEGGLGAEGLTEGYGEYGGGTVSGTEVAGGPSLGGAATVLGIVKAVDWNRQDQGQLDRPYEERGANAKFVSAPVMGGPPALLEAAGVNSSNYFAKPMGGLAKAEEKLVGGPLDKAFEGNIGGNITDFGDAAADLPGDLWQWVKSVFGS